MIAAVRQVISVPGPVVAEVMFCWASMSSVATAKIAPVMAKHRLCTRSARMPEGRAHSLLPPMASTSRPKCVLLSTSHVAATMAIARYTSSGRPSSFVLYSARNAAGMPE